MKNPNDKKHYFANFILPDIILGILCVYFRYMFVLNDPLGILFSYILIFPYILLPYIAALAAAVPLCETMGFRHYFSAPEYFIRMNRHSAIQILFSASAAVLLTLISLPDISGFADEFSMYKVYALPGLFFEAVSWKYFYPMILVISNLIGAIMLKRNVRKKQTEIFDRMKLNDKP